MITGAGATERLAAYIQQPADFVHIANATVDRLEPPKYIDPAYGTR